jgi:hypothetical protein
LDGEDRVQEVDHDVQRQDRDQVAPSRVERGDDEDRDAEDPDDERVGQSVEELGQVHQRWCPQVLEPLQKWRLRVRRDDRETDRDTGDEERDRRPAPRAPPGFARERRRFAGGAPAPSAVPEFRRRVTGCVARVRRPGSVGLHRAGL